MEQIKLKRIAVLSTDLNIVGIYVVRFIRRGVQNNTRVIIFERIKLCSSKVTHTYRLAIIHVTVRI